MVDFFIRLFFVLRVAAKRDNRVKGINSLITLLNEKEMSNVHGPLLYPIGKISLFFEGLYLL